jgi:hypothetical protein
MPLTEDQILALIVLARQVDWFYHLDSYTDAQLQQLLRSVQQAEMEVLARVDSYASALPEWAEERALALLDGFSDLSLGIRTILEGGITNIVSTAGAASFLMNNDILSFGDRVPNFNSVSLTAEQLRGLVSEVPIGGRILNSWVEDNYLNVAESIRQEITTGMLKGDSYAEFTARLMAGFDMGREDAITLSRDYVHSVNTYAQNEVYQANQDIINGVVWTCVLENSYKKSGHGTCIACALLDGTYYANGQARPPIPLHNRCRCCFLPKLKSFRELGFDMDEISDAYRPYVMRPDKNIDAGGRRSILEHGFEQNNYKDWILTRDDKFKLDLLGRGRFNLIESGKVNYSDLVDKTTGRLIPLRNLQ